MRIAQHLINTNSVTGGDLRIRILCLRRTRFDVLHHHMLTRVPLSFPSDGAEQKALHPPESTANKIHYNYSNTLLTLYCFCFCGGDPLSMRECTCFQRAHCVLPTASVFCMCEAFVLRIMHVHGRVFFSVQ